MDLDLTPEQWDALQRRKGSASTVSLNLALDKILAHRPKPALPTGWVLLRHTYGSHRVLWHEDGALYTYDDGSGNWGRAEDYRDILTPLRVLGEHEAAVDLRGFFVARDGYGYRAIWQEREGRDPVPALYQNGCPALFDALAADLPHKEDGQ